MDNSNNLDKQNDIKLINKYSVDEISLDDVFIFSVILCDNEIDRDNERFSIKTLDQLRELYLGKTGIFDHDHKAQNQIARIFKTEVLTDDSRKTKAGENYHFLKASAYMVKCEENTKLIKEISSGIKKEVSVGCSVEKVLCSKCNKDLKKEMCGHDFKKDAHKILENAIDAYEWSFVAIPAQIGAGVTKVFGGGFLASETSVFDSFDEFNSVNILKKLKDNEKLSEIENEKIYKYIKNLEVFAVDGQRYKDDLVKDLVKESFLSKSNMDANTIKNIAKKLSVDELVELKENFKEKRPDIQLGREFYDKKINDESNKDFKLKS